MYGNWNNLIFAGDTWKQRMRFSIYAVYIFPLNFHACRRESLRNCSSREWLSLIFTVFMFNVFFFVRAVLFRIEFDLRQKIFQWYCLSNFHAKIEKKTNWKWTNIHPKLKMFNLSPGLVQLCVMKHDRLFLALVFELWCAAPMAVAFARMQICVLGSTHRFVRISICHHDFQLQI